jgi:hypothetical protein
MCAPCWCLPLRYIACLSLRRAHYAPCLRSLKVRQKPHPPKSPSSFQLLADTLQPLLSTFLQESCDFLTLLIRRCFLGSRSKLFISPYIGKDVGQRFHSTELWQPSISRGSRFIGIGYESCCFDLSLVGGYSNYIDLLSAP